LERALVRRVVAEVWRMIPNGTDPYAAGFGLAVDEIAVRLQAAWGEEPTEAAAWAHVAPDTKPAQADQTTAIPCVRCGGPDGPTCAACEEAVNGPRY
jgi:hypothetical protein